MDIAKRLTYIWIFSSNVKYVLYCIQSSRMRYGDKKAIIILFCWILHWKSHCYPMISMIVRGHPIRS